MGSLVIFDAMALLDMIPPEYWRQLRRELNALDWSAIKSTEDAARQQAEQTERERRAKAYNEAVRRKNRQNSRESHRKWAEAHREQINAKQRERYTRLKAEKQGKPK